MIWKIKIFSLFRTEVYVQVTFVGIFIVFLLLALFIFRHIILTRCLVILTIYFLSIIVHESGHVWSARHYGLPIRSINFSFIGGNIELAPTSVPYSAQFNLILAGSAVNLVLSALAFLIAFLAMPGVRLFSLNPAYLSLVESIFWINAGIGVLNLLPVEPLDGGALFELWLKKRRFSAVQIEKMNRRIEISLIIGFTVLAVLFSWWFLLLSFFIFINRLMRRMHIHIPDEWMDQPISEFVISDIREVYPDLTVAEVLSDENPLDSTVWPVIGEDGNLMGVVTERDLQEKVRDGHHQVKIETLYRKDYPVLEGSQPLRSVYHLLKKSHWTAFPVVERGRFVGMFYPGLIRQKSRY